MIKEISDQGQSLAYRSWAKHSRSQVKHKPGTNASPEHWSNELSLIICATETGDQQDPSQENVQSFFSVTKKLLGATRQ